MWKGLRLCSAEAREMLRFDSGGASAIPALPPGAMGGGGGGGLGDADGGGLSAGAAGMWWGVRLMPRGAHRVPDEWSQPRVRSQRASVAAAAFLRALQRSG